MYSFLAKNLIYPLSDTALGTHVMKYYRLLQKTQWWSPEQLRELQNAKLQKLMKHTYENVPYYRRIFQERGLSDKDIQTIEDLAQFPILTKNDIRKNLKDMMVKDFKRWKPIPSSTGGATGEPMKYSITKDLASITWAGKFRGEGWAGYNIGDKLIKFGGTSIVPQQTTSLFEIVRNKLERKINVSALSMNKLKYDTFIRIIRQHKPAFIYSYASTLYLFAEYCKSNDVNDIRFKAVFSTAEMLLPKFRESIESQFQCKIFNEYGAYDGGVQAMECDRHQGFHISAEKVVMEIVDEQGQRLLPGKAGRIIVTDLHNYAMPFIRYEVGDIGTLTDELCACGRGLPLLKALEGRATDVIRLSNGTFLTGVFITSLFEKLPVKQFQAIQEAGDRICLNIVKGEAYSDKDTEYILDGFKYHAGKDTDLRLEFCDQIPVENNKYRYVISKI